MHRILIEEIPIKEVEKPIPKKENVVITVDHNSKT